MAKEVGGNLKFLFAGSTTGVISVVADRTARDLIATPSDGDYAYIEDLDTIDKYVTAAWVDDGGNADQVGITSLGFGQAGTEETTTDNLTTGDGEESVLTAVETTLTVDARLKDGSGNVVHGGSTMSYIHGGTTYKVLSLTYAEAYNQADTTDSETADLAMDFEPTRAKRTSTIELLTRDDVADLALDGANAASTMTFYTGLTVVGTCLLTALDAPMAVDDTQIQTYNGSYQGAVTESIGDITSAEKRAALLVSGSGRTYLGSAASLGKTINISSRATGTISYTLKFAGEVTKAIA